MRSENNLSRLSITELTTAVISLPSESRPLLFHILIAYIIFPAGENPRGGGGTGGIFIGYGKICDTPEGLLVAVFCLLMSGFLKSSIYH